LKKSILKIQNKIRW